MSNFEEKSTFIVRIMFIDPSKRRRKKKRFYVAPSFLPTITIHLTIIVCVAHEIVIRNREKDKDRERPNKSI